MRASPAATPASPLPDMLRRAEFAALTSAALGHRPRRIATVNPAPPYPPRGETDPPDVRPEPADGSGGSTAFPVVGVGASAGGLEAFGQLLGAVPDDTGMAFVLVQHLDPKHESKLGELLARATRMPVIEATQGLAIRPNHVYVIPPNTYLAVAGGILQVTPRGE